MPPGLKTWLTLTASLGLLDDLKETGSECPFDEVALDLIAVVFFVLA